MKFDFTSELALDSKLYRQYRWLQLALYLVALTGALYFAYLILFPEQAFVFSFANPNASTNNIAVPRSDASDTLPAGQTPANGNVYFDATAIGNFSTALVSFTLDPKATSLNGATIYATRSYRNFLLPQGNPIGFNDGSLLRNNGNYYIVSAGRLRKFADVKLLTQMGFNPESFLSITSAEMQANPADEEIADANTYPNGTLFKIASDYYILTNGKLKKFVTQEAFASIYNPATAISKDATFLKQYESVPELAGFSDGSLISYGDGIYVVSQGQIFPIDNPVTFLSLGYNFGNVIPTSSDALALYTKGKLLNLKGIHPDGTIFVTAEDKNYYIIRNGQKDPLLSENVARSWSRSGFVTAYQKSLSLSDQCTLKKRFLTANTYECVMKIDNLEKTLGKDYEFKQQFSPAIKISALNVTFQKAFMYETFRESLRSIFNGIISNYVTLQP